MFLTMVTVGAPAASTVLGAIGLGRLAGLVVRMGYAADWANHLVEGVQAANQLRNALFPQPEQGSSPRPFIPDSSTQQASYQTPANSDINNFDIIPVFTDQVSLQLGVLNNEGADFGAYDLYATVKQVNAPAPRTLDEIWGSGDLPSVIVSPPPNRSFDHKVLMPVPPNNAYVSYSWKVPRGQQPTNEFIANNAFIGPAFLAIDEASYAVSMQDEIISGKNLEARFQLPA